MKNLLKAARFAAAKHRGQRRKNAAADPYINHPIEVAEHLARVGAVNDERILVAALLHDTLEDTDATEEEIREAFGEDVLTLVLECTDDKRLPKAERKRLQIVNAPHKSAAAKMIKIADKTSNLRGLLCDPPKDWSSARRREYFEWAGRVVDGLKGANTSLDEAFQRIYEEGAKSWQGR